MVVGDVGGTAQRSAACPLYTHLLLSVGRFEVLCYDLSNVAAGEVKLVRFKHIALVLLRLDLDRVDQLLLHLGVVVEVWW